MIVEVHTYVEGRMSKDEGKRLRPAAYVLRPAMVIFLFILFLIPARSLAQDQIVAVVNKEVITEKDLLDFTRFMQLQLSRQYQGDELQQQLEAMIPDLLEKLIEDRLILQEAERQNIKIDENTVKNRIKEIVDSYESPEQFESALDGQGVVRADLERRIREQLLSFRLVEEKVRSRIQVQPEEVTRFFQENQQEFEIGEEREVVMLTAEYEDIAGTAAYDLRRGIDVEDITQRYDLTATTLFAYEKDNMRADIKEVIFRLKADEVSKPLWMDGKYYIFKVLKITPPRARSLQDVQDKIYAYLSQKKLQEKMGEWLIELKKKAYIKVMEPR